MLFSSFFRADSSSQVLIQTCTAVQWVAKLCCMIIFIWFHILNPNTQLLSSFLNSVLFKSSLVEAIVQFESIPEEVNTRSLREFVVDTIEDTHTERRCGMLCTKHNYCKSYNHNGDGALCELIMTDYRLLEKPRGKYFL